MQAFLNRVTFNETKICENLMSFANLSLLGDDEYDGEPMENTIQLSQHYIDEVQALEEPKMCVTCVEKPPDCVLVPCGHLLMCMGCFEKWKETNTEWNGLSQDGDEEVPPLPTDQQKPHCPFCNVAVTNHVKLRPC